MKTLRISLISLSLAIAAFGAAQYEDPALQIKVDFKTPATNAAAAIEKLSASSGVKLMSSPQVASEILYINVTDVPLADLMKRISIVASGEWRAEEGGYRLIRPVGRGNAEANTERLERVNKIRQAIAKRVAALTPKAQAGQGNNPFGGFMGMGGDADRPITKLLALIDPSAIANLEKGGRIVFATNPNRMQRPIYGNIAPIIGEYIQVHNAAIKAKPDEDNEGMSDEDRASLQEFMKLFGGDQSDKPVDARPAKVLLSIARGGGMMSMFGGGIQVELMLFNDKGEVVLKGQSSISDGESIFEDMMNGMVAATAEATAAAIPGAQPPKPPQEEKFPGENGDIEFTKTSREVATLFGEGGMMGGNFGMPKKLSPELEALMLRPDLNDPLAFAETDSLDSVAKVKKWDIVANLPDSRLSFFASLMGQGASKKVDDYLRSVKGDKAIWFELVTVGEGTWLTLKPMRPVAARAERVDRLSLARLLAAAKAKSLPGLDDYAVYAQKNAAPFDTPAATLYLALFAPNAMAQGMMGLTDWNMIRFYGAMNPTQRMGLKNGVTVSMLNLEFSQKALLERMLYGADHQLKVGPPKVDTEPFFMKIFSTMFGGQASSWKQEPTEVMPNGLPNEGVVNMSSVQSMIGKAEDENEMSAMFGALGPAELAMFELFKDDPNMAQAGAMMPQIGRLKLGSRIEYRFLFQVAADVSTQRTLNDDNVPKDGQLVTLDQLPDEFKKQIAESAAAMKNSPFWKMATMGRAREIPPPPSR